MEGHPPRAAASQDTYCTVDLVEMPEITTDQKVLPIFSNSAKLLKIYASLHHLTDINTHFYL